MQVGLDAGTPKFGRDPLVDRRIACAYIGILVGARNAEFRPRLQDALGRNANVIVLFQRDLDQVAESWILEDFPPFHIAE